MIDPQTIKWKDLCALCSSQDNLEAYLVRVREAMKEQGMSGAQLARRMGKSSSFVNAMLRHDYGDVTLHFVREVAENLKVTP
jgi:transcriptional regulator with XRE-family HTH domain